MNASTKSGCREEVLRTFDALTNRTGRREFELKEIVEETLRRTKAFAESTIRTHVVSRMCRNSAKNHTTVYDDLERVRSGVYRTKA